MPNPLIELLHKLQEEITQINAENLPDLAPIFQQIETGIEGQDAVLGESTTQINDLNQAITDLKAKNYELLVKIPQTENPEKEGGENDTDEKPIEIDDLFKKTGGE